MKCSTVIAACALVLALAASLGAAEDLARGWGASINWRTLDAGKAEAKASGKPIMVVIHKTWCGACKALKPQVAASEEVADLSENFVMVNLEDSEEPDDASFSPDGGYIPRILFLDSDGTVKDEVYNVGGNAKYKYYYSSGADVAKGMKNALKFFETN